MPKARHTKGHGEKPPELGLLFGVENAVPEGRIRGVSVAALFPKDGAEGGLVHTVLYGEAPGPRGADQSGIPFWGDGAGLPLYRALEAAGCAVVPAAAWQAWDGARFVQLGLYPELKGVVLSNAFPVCPTSDGHRFRAPKRAELTSAENLGRIEAELSAAKALGAVQVVTLGKCAAQTLEPLAAASGLQHRAVPHPSAQGLLSDAPNRGRGQRLSDLQAAWQKRLESLLAEGALFLQAPGVERHEAAP